MKISFLIHQSKKQSAASYIDLVFPLNKPRHWRVLLIWISALLWAWFLLYPPNFAFLQENTLRDLSFLFTAILLLSFQLSWFVIYWRFKKDSRVSFDLAKYLFSAHWKTDPYSLIHSEMMREILLRAGLSKESFSDFFQKIKNTKNIEVHDIEDNGKVDLGMYLAWMFDSYRPFAESLSVYGITRKSLIETALWVEDMNTEKAKSLVFWDSENLYVIKSLGVEWTKSTQTIAKNCGSPLEETSLFADSSSYWRMYRKDIDSLEKILLKENRTHALLISDTVPEGARIVSSLAHAIQKGEINSDLEHKRMILVDDNSFWDGDRSKEKVSLKFKELLKCAWHSGAVLVLDDFDQMINRIYEVDHSLLDDFEKFLSSVRFHVIAIVSENGYHQTIVPHQNILKMFSIVRPVNMAKRDILNLLTSKLKEIEEEKKVLFTFDVLEMIYESSKACMPEKSIQEASVYMLDKIKKGLRDKGVINKEKIASILNPC